MVGAFGLLGDAHPSHFPGDRLVENVERLDIRMLARCGALTPGAVTELEISPVGCPRPIRTVRICREGPGVTIDGTLVRLTWGEAFGGDRPWFVCPGPGCGRRVQHVVVRGGTIGCRRCFHLDYASRHLRRQTPGVARVARLRRKLGAEERPFAPLPPCQRGRKRDYDALVTEIFAEEMRLVAYLGSIVYDLRRRLRGRRGPKRHDRIKATPRSDPSSA